MNQVRWKCEICDNGLLAPTKPRMNDVRRYCLPCSAETGKLVERISPALKKKRTKKKVARKKKSVAKRAAVAKKTAPIKAQQKLLRERRAIIDKEAEKIWKLMQPYHKGKPLPRIKIARGKNWGSQGGHAVRFGNEIQINVDRTQNRLRSVRVWEVLAHELCHIAVPPIHRNGSWDVHSREFYHCLKHTWQKRWKCEISFAEVSTWGYSVDYIIQRQAAHLIDFELPTITEAK